MNDTLGETLSRLIDGDDVDLSLLAQAIQREDGRRLLMDFATLRQTVRSDDEILRGLQRQPPVTLMGLFRLSTTWQRLVAATAMLLIGGGLVLLRIEGWRGSRADAPPRVERVLRFEPSEWTFANAR